MTLPEVVASVRLRVNYSHTTRLNISAWHTRLIFGDNSQKYLPPLSSLVTDIQDLLSAFSLHWHLTLFSKLKGWKYTYENLVFEIVLLTSFIVIGSFPIYSQAATKRTSNFGKPKTRIAVFVTVLFYLIFSLKTIVRGRIYYSYLVWGRERPFWLGRSYPSLALSVSCRSPRVFPALSLSASSYHEPAPARLARRPLAFASFQPCPW